VFLVVFGQVRVRDRKSAERAQVGMVCGAGAGKISQTHAEGFKFCECGAGAVKKFQPALDSSGHTLHEAYKIIKILFE